MKETKYGKYFVHKPARGNQLAHGVDIPAGKKITGRTGDIVYMSNKLVPGSDIHLSVNWIHEVPFPNPFVVLHSHPYDELLYFIGTNPANVEDLGGEVEFVMGDERHVFDTTTVVFIPKNIPHQPIYKRVDRAQMLLAICLSGEYV